jgi:uncharacterized protein YecA (UPF0149 family)
MVMTSTSGTASAPVDAPKPTERQQETRRQMDQASRPASTGNTGYMAREKSKQPGPNDPCWCNSGKKYKKCHMTEDQAKAGR